MFGGECDRRSRKIHPSGTGGFCGERSTRVGDKGWRGEAPGDGRTPAEGPQHPTEELGLFCKGERGAPHPHPRRLMTCQEIQRSQKTRDLPFLSLPEST